jgi:hypothetical protein
MVYWWALLLNLMQWASARRPRTIFADLDRGSHDAARCIQMLTILQDMQKTISSRTATAFSKS